MDGQTDQIGGARPPYVTDAIHDAVLAGLAEGERTQLGRGLAEEIAVRGLGALSEAKALPLVDWVRMSTAPSDTGQPLMLFRVLNPDMPFLVDSVMNTMQHHDVEARVLLHPLLEIARDGSGGIADVSVATRSGSRGVASADEHAAPDTASIGRHSLILVGIEAITADLADIIVEELRRTLADVAASVADWRAMQERFARATDELAAARTNVDADRQSEAVAFMRWMLDGQFVFLGMREYRLTGDAASGELETLAGSGLGVLRDPDVQVLRRGSELVALTPEVRAFYLEPRAVFVTKSNVVSRVHRAAHMDYIGVKLYGSDGALAGELRVVGLFTSKAYTMAPADIPLLRLKAERVIADAGYVAGSHDAKALVNVIDTFPRDELFQIPINLLADWARQIVSLETRPQTRLFVRIDPFNRFVSALVFMSRERFSTAVRQRIGEHLAEKFGGRVVMFQPYFTEGRLVRVHFIIGRFGGTAPGTIDVAQLEQEVAELSRNWRDRLANAIAAMPAATDGSAAVSSSFCAAYPNSYVETHGIQRALVDAAAMERLTELDPVGVRIYRADDHAAGHLGAAIYSAHGPIPLSERVPVFEAMGFRVIEEQTYQVKPPARLIELHDMKLDAGEMQSDAMSPDDIARIEACFLAVQSGRAESDGFNALVAGVGATWRQAAMLRAYGLYLRQTNAPVGPRLMARTLAAYPVITQTLLALFDDAFDPSTGASVEHRIEARQGHAAAIEAALADVPSLDEDRIIRSFLNLMQATLRTNFFQMTPEGAPPPTIAFKFDADAVAAIPEPKPYREIWVYSPRVEGVHLRFAPIARGGLRWSDREQDFRTEVLGLAKAQQVKNTVIVPEGAKGGFYPKQMPTGGDRAAVMAEGVASYERFIGTMLDITDNIVDGEIVVPRDVVRFDGDDPYLVVAADKGTATFSDYANALSIAKGHWLGDAFASGGSAGYDHKKMGITARGAWECVKRHFRERDLDIQTTPFSVVGVGDMSGDVFGNGMLLSPAIQLVAAFDHRDIFIDPNPDPVSSLAERERLFALGRSSWQDYDTSKLSAGGGIFPRASKSIDLTPEIRERLGISERAVTPNALMRAILKAEADLMWFGGIGTYVRAPDQTDADVGDRANDAIRVTSDDLRVRAIGEGANLGATQEGRVAFAARGGRINTDFIDNSAGVNSSDIEVNIKIALGAAVASGKLDIEARNALLTRMTEEVAASCLRNNQQQALAISLVEREGATRLGYLSRLMTDLESRGLLDRDIEDLPDAAASAERAVAGRGLERPEIAVLLSHAKIALSAELMQGQLANDPALEPLLFAYFPSEMRRDYADEIRGHRLAKEIVVTAVTNSIANRAGPAAVIRLADETGRTTGEIAKALMVVRDVFDLPALWRDIEALGFDVSGSQQLALLGEIQATMVDAAAASLRSTDTGHLAELVATDRPVVERIAAALTTAYATDKQVAAHSEIVARLTAANVPEAIARAYADLGLVRYAPMVRRLSAQSGAPIERVAPVVFNAIDQFRLADLTDLSRSGGVTDYYDRLALSSAMAAIEKAASDAARIRLDGGPSAGTRIDRAAERLEDVVASGGVVSVSRLTVVASQIRDLMQG